MVLYHKADLPQKAKVQHHMEDAIISEVKDRVKRFSKKIGKEKSLPGKRFISEMLFGILGSGDTKLTSIGRVLKEPIAIQQTVKRLSRNLADIDITNEVNRTMVSERMSSLEPEAIIAIDGSDIRKPYAESMEHLYDIHDGSRHERGKGYLMFCMASVGKETVKPLYGEMYSTTAPEYRSSYDITTRGLDMLVEQNKERNQLTIVADRGYDDEKLYRYYQDKGLRFITRIRRDRNFMLSGSQINRKVDTLYGYTKSRKMQGEVIHEGRVKEVQLSVAMVRGRISNLSTEYTVIVIKSRLFQEPMYLMTNIRVENHQSAYRVYAKYLKRWGIETMYRLMKEKFNLEDMRVLRYKRMRNLFSLMMGSLYLVSKIVYTVGNKTDFLQKQLIRKAKRLRKDGTFLYYSIIDGLKQLVARLDKKLIFFEHVYWSPPAYSLFAKIREPKNG